MEPARPAEIAEELNGLLRDPEARAIIAHDGGQTALGCLDLIDVDAITADPKPSSATATSRCCIWCSLRARAWSASVPTLATPGLGGHWQAASAARQAVLQELSSRLPTGDAAIGALRFDGAVLF
ncbi:LD-carboxypeptidase [Streptomyces mirabilis]|uniref:LD-carboxypeptidase n=1 Tax=Streptomyces mirabilis TaxID=68239 RepID=UPI0033B825DD